MGVTIYFQGQLRDEAAYHAAVSLANDFAARLGWPATPILEESVVLHRVKDEQDCDYTGPAKGLVIQPHENCDPFRLEFDENLFLQDFVKTQFAPIEVHIRIVELLKLLVPHFQKLEVEDEGEYFETLDQEPLRRHIDRCFEVMEEYLRESDKYRGPVRSKDGRIIDLEEID